MILPKKPKPIHPNWLPWVKYCYNIKQRAYKEKAQFELTPSYIKELVPKDKLCPIMQRRMIMPGEVGDRWYKISIDRIIPSKGYIHGNVAIISVIANTIKRTETDPAVFRRIADYIEKYYPPS